MVNLLQKVFGKREKTQMVKDPVCGMEIDPKSARATLEKDGQTYYFCSVSCKEQFAEGEAKKDQSGGDRHCC